MVGLGKALVTGGSGFVGSHLVVRLVEANRSVRVISRSPRRRSSGMEAEWFIGDIQDRTKALQATIGIDTVFHAAALIPGRGSDQESWETNVEGTRNIVQACLQNQVKRLVFVSSIAVYKVPLPPVVDESMTTGGLDAYAKSKCAAEGLIHDLCAGKIDYSVVRPCQVYGPGDGTGYTGRLLKLLASPIQLLPGKAGRPFSLVHVEDLVDALLLAEATASQSGGTYNITSGPPICLSELADLFDPEGERFKLQIGFPIAWFRAALTLRWMIKSLMRGNLRSWWRSYAEGHTHGSMLLGGPAYAIERANLELGYRPKKSFQEGIMELNSLNPPSRRPAYQANVGTSAQT